MTDRESSLPRRSERGERTNRRSAQSGRASGTEPDEFACVFHSATICALCFASIEIAADSTVATGFVGCASSFKRRGHGSAEGEEDASCDCKVLLHG